MYDHDDGTISSGRQNNTLLPLSIVQHQSTLVII